MDASEATSSEASVSEDPACRVACETAIPDPLPCGMRAAIVSACADRCTGVTNIVNPACADCVRGSISYPIPMPDPLECNPPAAWVGVGGKCAITACDTIFPCYSGTCAPLSHCVQPCGPMMGADGICAFAASGTCACQAGLPSTNACASGATCVCPSCGDGEGLCLTPRQRGSVCAPFSIDAANELRRAAARFNCAQP
jgi:hypothetical protein